MKLLLSWRVAASSKTEIEANQSIQIIQNIQSIQIQNIKNQCLYHRNKGALALFKWIKWANESVRIFDVLVIKFSNQERMNISSSKLRDLKTYWTKGRRTSIPIPKLLLARNEWVTRMIDTSAIYVGFRWNENSWSNIDIQCTHYTDLSPMSVLATPPTVEISHSKRPTPPCHRR